MYEDIKWIADAYRIKCSKYTKEQLTPELLDILFDEAFKEYCMINHINSLSSEKSRQESF